MSICIHGYNAYCAKCSKTLSELKAMLIGADFLIKKLSFERDLSEGLEEQINESQKDMEPLIYELNKGT